MSIVDVGALLRALEAAVTEESLSTLRGQLPVVQTLRRYMRGVSRVLTVLYNRLITPESKRARAPTVAVPVGHPSRDSTPSPTAVGANQQSTL